MHVNNRFPCSLAIAAALILAAGLFSPGAAAVAQVAGTSDLPERSGARPIAIPDCQGVDQLLVLSDRWVVVVISTIEEVVSEIDTLSQGNLAKVAGEWESSLSAGRPNWRAKRTAGEIRDQFIAKARENAGERELEQAGSFRISSTDDPRYSTPQPPGQLGHTLVGLGAGRQAGAPDVDYAHYCYISFPQPMESGRTYTITIRDRQRVTFAFDLDRTVSRAIKINQAGYLSDAPQKFAYLGCHIYGVGPMDCGTYPRFEVVNANDGTVALAGEIKLRDRNSRVVPERRGGPSPDSAPAGERVPGAERGPGAGRAPGGGAPGAERTSSAEGAQGATRAPGGGASGAERAPGGGAPGGDRAPLLTGEDVYEMNLAGLEATGDFYIRIPGVGRSWPFHHGPDTYGPVFYTAARGLYHQRCGVACEAPYTPWKRARCHTAPVFESEHVAFGPGEFGKPREYQSFDVIGATLDRSRKTENAWGGWHDAADWDRNNQHYTVLFDLLYAYEIAPGNFTDGQLNLPESGNGIPDVLDEAAFGLEIWAKSMTPEGGVSGHVETYGHPSYTQDIDYAFSRRTRWDSLLFAAAAAQLAQHLKPFAPGESERWGGLALKAYGYGNDPANSLGKIEIPAKKNRGRGDAYVIPWEEKEAYVAPFLLHARVRLYRLSGDESYLDGIARAMHETPKPYNWPYTFKDLSPWLYFGMLHDMEAVLPDFQARKLLQSYLIEPAEKLVGDLDSMPYRCTWPRNQTKFMGFGNTDMTNAGRALLIAYALTDDARFRDAAIQNFDFMLGANPMGMSWTTGLGYVYPVNIQHEISDTDGIADPVPGITLYGISGSMYRALRDIVWQSRGPSGPVVFDAPDVPLWRRWSCHPTLNVAQCEFTIHETMSSTIFCSALLMDAGWTPPEALKARAPRPAEALYGHWYLP